VSETIVLAVHSIDLGEGEMNPPGYDLDHTCACFMGMGPSCVSPIQHCDFPDGVDNGASKLVQLIQIGLGAGNFGSSYFSTKADEGHWSLLIQVTGYNGMADDPQVDVAVFPSPGLSGATPKWDGTDTWPVTASSVMNGDITKPVYVSMGAYVSNHVLVAALTTVPLTISGSTMQTITITLSEGVFTGTLSGVGNNWEVTDGILAARWAQEDIFGALSSYRNGMGQPFCTNVPLVYSTAKTAVCNGLDILKDGAGAKSLPCDALSMGIGFKAQSALIGSVITPPPPTPGCPPQFDPANDSCFAKLDGGDGG
jgi:hypothetical protein